MHLLRAGGVFLLAVDWGQISGGSVLNGILVTAAIIGGGSWAVRQFRKDSAESQLQALDAMQKLYDATAKQLELEKNAHASVAEALELATQDAHKLELEVKEREKDIARLEAMPDTAQMLRVFNEHHAENQALGIETREVLRELVGETGDMHQILQTMLDRPNRRTNPGGSQ